MPDPLATISTRHAPQTQKADARQVPNSAGGFTFTTGKTARLHRFLTLGTDGGTYYVSERDITQASAAVVLGWAREDATELTAQIAAISQAGRAPRNNPALFALSAAASLGDDAGRRAALDALPLVARTGTHLFIFARYVQQFRGWGRGLRRAVGNWYLSREPGHLAYQALKYRQREGWTHRDLLRLSHPEGTGSQRALFDWICGREADLAELPLVHAFVQAQTLHTAKIPALIQDNPGLSWEMLPDTALASPLVWMALLQNGMPQTALMRQLPRLTRLGVIGPMSAGTRIAAAQLTDRDRLMKARVHPVNVLVALRTYASGHSARGAGEWKPVPAITDALDAAFYAAFAAVEPAGKRTMLALDVSGSMTSPVSGLPLTCREASAALALVTASTEPQTVIAGFTSSGVYRSAGLSVLDISPRQRLDDAIRKVSGLPFGATDCSLPMVAALQQGMEIDHFSIYCADAETEILTADGWRRYDEVRVNDEVYTLDHVTGLGEWQHATAINVFPAMPRQMLQMEGRGHSSLTTLNHRWPVRHRGNPVVGPTTWGRRWRTSETLNQVDYIQCAAADSGLPSEPKFTDAFVELMAWIWTEGHVNGSRGIGIAQSLTVHPDYCDRIDAALRHLYGSPHNSDMRALHAVKLMALNTAAWRRNPSRPDGYTNWQLNQAAAAPFLNWMTVPEKIITPEFFRSLTRAQLELFIQASIDADGWRLQGGSARLSQHSLARAESFQIACTLAGYATSLARISGREQWEVGVLRRVQFAPLAHAANADDRPFTVERVEHNGPVWCPTTPNGTWLARRNGTVYWTGNTDNETWAGLMHPHQALRQYREKTGITARMSVIGMTSTDFTIADPDDPGQMDVAGFDSAVPSLLADFARGDI